MISQLWQTEINFGHLLHAVSMLKSLDCGIKRTVFQLKLTLEYVKLPEYRALA